jgi:hypothetical protein
MHVKLKARLQNKISDWLDENADDIGDIHGVYQDDTTFDGTALLLASAVEVAFDAMVHQSELIEKLGS